MRQNDELQYIQEAIKCLESLKDRFGHTPIDHETLNEIDVCIDNLEKLLNGANKSEPWQKYVEHAIQLLKIIWELTQINL